MIQAKEALAWVKKKARRLPVERVAVADAAGRVLAMPLKAAAPYPLFDNSAMDGYALRARDCRKASPSLPFWMPVAGRSLAGRAPGRLEAGTAWAVMTGAPLPKGADAVVQREHCIELGGKVGLLAAPKPGGHVRRRGEDWPRGGPLLPAGTQLGPGAMAVAAASGLGRLACVRKPRVGLLVTGDELTDAGRRPGPGRIYDSNGPMLAGALGLDGSAPVLHARVPDRLEAFRTAISGALAACDVVLLSGGVSVGDKDHSKEALLSLGVRQVFWRVAQRPGKPLFFGLRGPKLFFGLPGNPAAALVCYLEYVRPALAALEGRAFENHWASGALAAGLANQGDRMTFFRAELRAGSVRLCRHQGSHALSSLAGGNCLLAVPAGARWAAGRGVRVHPFGVRP